MQKIYRINKENKKTITQRKNKISKKYSKYQKKINQH